MLYENYPFVYTVFTQLFVFILLLFSFSKYYPAKQNHIQLLLLSSFSVGVLLINEKKNGNKLLEWWPDFPFHVFIELLDWLRFIYRYFVLRHRTTQCVNKGL